MAGYGLQKLGFLLFQQREILGFRLPGAYQAQRTGRALGRQADARGQLFSGQGGFLLLRAGH